MGKIQPLDIQESRQPGVEGIAEELDAEITRPHGQDDRVRRKLPILFERDAVGLGRLHGPLFGRFLIDDWLQANILRPVSLPKKDEPPNPETEERASPERPTPAVAPQQQTAQGFNEDV